jgi:hypothetical protein
MKENAKNVSHRRRHVMASASWRRNGEMAAYRKAAMA